MFGYHVGTFPMMGFGMIIGVVIIVGIFIFLFQTSKKEKGTKSPQDILDERYAKGEIEIEEYNQKSENIKNR